ncbi:hypothetical protein WN48_05686 [Eufriesea mexicana]|uniref:uncharacterized protein LOC108556224 n=1 Tax=Eufriesea mexicana TaxID=516756 RepID=UPI00083C3607|nr:PREDICTED: uncharacterized protein LOC108556224 [Eufriesea mexicana]OAD60387.1 hypothetical protein WN48_05686 [Eufriesea mexicana]
MGTVSIDLRAVDTSERRGSLGGSSHAAGSSSEDAEPDEPGAVAVGNEDRLRGALHTAPAEDQEGNGRRFPAEDAEPSSQILKFAYPKGKRNNGKKSSRCKRRVTFAL